MSTEKRPETQPAPAPATPAAPAQKQSKKPLVIIVTMLVVALAASSFYWWPLLFGGPVLSLETPGQLSAQSREAFNVDIVLSGMPEGGSYPAASVSVLFNSNKLEFVGSKLGTMEATSPGGGMTIPEWACNPAVSNQKGQVNAMYLDMSAGDSAYVPDGFEKDVKDVVLRLSFTLKDSAQAGDTLEFTFEDAAFAVVAPEESALQMVDNTLRVRKGVLTLTE